MYILAGYLQIGDLYTLLVFYCLSGFVCYLLRIHFFQDDNLDQLTKILELTRKLFLLWGPEFVESLQNDSLAYFKSKLWVSAAEYVYKHVKNKFKIK